MDTRSTSTSTVTSSGCYRAHYRSKICRTSLLITAYLRFVATATDDPEYLAQAVDEHQAMLHAVMTRDGDAITSLIATHIQSAANVLLSSVETAKRHHREADKESS